MTKAKQSKGKQQTIKEFEEALIDLSRVTKVTAGGRQLKFRATVAVGNKKGKVGLGMGKSNEVTTAIQKAVKQAKKHLITINLNGSTIPHEARAKFKSAKLLLMPAVEGTGIIAGSSVRQILEVAGVKNVLAKRFGTKNKISNAKVAMKILEMLQENPHAKKMRNENEK